MDNIPQNAAHAGKGSNDPAFARTVALLVLIGLLHFAGVRLHLYWTVWWFDIVMHFLGGIAVSLGFLWMRRRRILKLPGRYDSPAWAAAFGIVLIGTMWEVFEYSAGATFVRDGYVADTLLDLLMDFIGAGFAVIYDTRLTKSAS